MSLKITTDSWICRLEDEDGRILLSIPGDHREFERILQLILTDSQYKRYQNQDGVFVLSGKREATLLNELEKLNK